MYLQVTYLQHATAIRGKPRQIFAVAVELSP